MRESDYKSFSFADSIFLLEAKDFRANDEKGKTALDLIAIDVMMYEIRKFITLNQ